MAVVDIFYVNTYYIHVKNKLHFSYNTYWKTYLFAMLFFNLLRILIVHVDGWIRRVKCPYKDKQDIEKLEYRQI